MPVSVMALQSFSLSDFTADPDTNVTINGDGSATLSENLFYFSILLTKDKYEPVLKAIAEGGGVIEAVAEKTQP